MTAAISATLAAVAAYWAGRVRLGRRLLEWAEDRNEGSHGPGWWAAQGVGLAAVAWMITVHPRRSAANRRSWQEACNARRSPAPQFDSGWAAKRDTTTRDEPR
ncbi:hypothetical protein [Actinacidiphila sp. ITFR-21]|uniref:hypothetical protein n=1 Tax=Actinacidiphila sp. ITFR-21 TaxID=3075199 RepID=UPI00288BDB43|nr:hypothetical protein [Streptomyces sp. ITFR-21]WNI19214.1 hypothetical protein RLT57_29165 [Streptomyces sp. ITFR-21]